MLMTLLPRVRALTASSVRLHAVVRSFAVTTVNVPSMGDSISEGTLVQIVKSVGEPVHADEVVAILETDKVSVDVMSPIAGTVVEHFVQLEENVEVGKPLFAIDDAQAPTTAAPTANTTTTTTTSTTSSTPAPAPAPASTPVAASSSGHRTPLIKFLGKRALLPSKPSPLLQSSSIPTPMPATVTPSSANVLSFQHRKRIPLSSNEVHAINSGIAFL